MDFMRAMAIAEAGFDIWASKDHNRKWVRQIDGTPIRNDLLVNIAMAFIEDDRCRVPRCVSCGTLMRRNCPTCEKDWAS